MYDYLIVGAGLSGAIFAYEATKRGKKVKVIDKRDHIGGNIYCENVEGVNVHKYGAHIFHTSNKKVWDYVNQFAEFNNYINSPVANYKGSLYNLPFNMNTFYAMWGTKTPQEVKDKIAEQTAHMKDVEPKNLEEQAIKLIGLDIYEKLIKGYTEKQWGRSATDLPPFIIKRLPVRLTFDNNYFNDRYQGIPIGGYNVIIENMLKDVEVELGVDFFANRQELEASAEKVVFTGMIDQYFDYKHGELEYRSLRFEHEVLDDENIKEMQLLTIRNEKFLILVLLSINTLSMVHKIKRSLLVNTQLIGNVEMSLIIQSMMRETMLCLLNIKKKQHRMIRLFSADVWPIINTTTCTWSLNVP